MPLLQFALKMYNKNGDFGQFLMDIFTSITFENKNVPIGYYPPQIYPSQVTGLKKANIDIYDENVAEKVLDYILSIKTMEQ